MVVLKERRTVFTVEKKMKVAVIGGGGREQTIIKKPVISDYSELVEEDKYLTFICKCYGDWQRNENNEYFCSSDGVLYNKDKTELLAYPAEKTETSYTLAASVESFEPLSILANNYIKNLNVSADNPKYSSKSGVVMLVFRHYYNALFFKLQHLKKS